MSRLGGNLLPAVVTTVAWGAEVMGALGLVGMALNFYSFQRTGAFLTDSLTDGIGIAPNVDAVINAVSPLGDVHLNEYDANLTALSVSGAVVVGAGAVLIRAETGD